MKKKYELEFYTKTGTSDPIDSQENLNAALFEQTGTVHVGQDQTFYMSDEHVIFVNSYEDDLEFDEEDTHIPDAIAIVQEQAKKEAKGYDIEEDTNLLYTALYDNTNGFSVISILNGTNYSLGELENELQAHQSLSLSFPTLNELKLYIAKRSVGLERTRNFLVCVSKPIHVPHVTEPGRFFVMYFKEKQSFEFGGLVKCQEDDVEQIVSSIQTFNLIMDDEGKKLRLSEPLQSLAEAKQFIRSMSMTIDELNTNLNKLNIDPVYIITMNKEDQEHR